MFVALEYLSSQAYSEVHQGSTPTPTYYSVQTIQRFGEHGPSQGPLPCNTVLVVVIWSCRRRSPTSPRPLASVLAFLILLVEGLHGHGQ